MDVELVRVPRELTDLRSQESRRRLEVERLPRDADSDVEQLNKDILQMGARIDNFRKARQDRDAEIAREHTRVARAERELKE